MNDQSGWEGILDEDERILWQGRPDGHIALIASHYPLMAFGTIFAGFALFWMIMAGLSGGYFWMFGLIHFLIGAALVVGPPLFSAFRRRRTWYTLTDRRAFIATDLPLTGRNFKSYPIDEDARLDFVDGDPSSVHFAEAVRRGKNRTYRIPVGFERIEDGREVYRLIRKVQSGEAGDLQ
ncbi:MAG: aspartate carbamoyltransferase catalytic subunit [Boseongicola sp.]